MKLDLHGTKHDDVRRKVDMFIWENMRTDESQVTIVTGHSIEMKNIVRQVVTEYGMSSREEFTNGGAMIIFLH
jgi:DNA-nicking Smr family endonuclease